MTDEQTPFIEYWEAVDTALLKFFGVDTSDVGIDESLIASAQEECQTPEDFARWYGEKYDLTYLDDWKALYGVPAARTRKIAALNDLCRKAMGIAGRVFQTTGISALPQQDQSAVREKVETFAAFTPDNDPYSERDFGAFEHNAHRIFWKIDYYDATLTKGSEDPSDPKKTVRVLTIMLASEY
ncbi:MAG: DUF3768 domain-containing protein [Bryobacteraceae bacterium]